MKANTKKFNKIMVKILCIRQNDGIKKEYAKGFMKIPYISYIIFIKCSKEFFQKNLYEFFFLKEIFNKFSTPIKI